MGRGATESNIASRGGMMFGRRRSSPDEIAYLSNTERDVAVFRGRLELMSVEALLEALDVHSHHLTAQVSTIPRVLHTALEITSRKLAEQEQSDAKDQLVTAGQPVEIDPQNIKEETELLRQLVTSQILRSVEEGESIFDKVIFRDDGLKRVADIISRSDGVVARLQTFRMREHVRKEGLEAAYDQFIGPVLWMADEDAFTHQPELTGISAFVSAVQEGLQHDDEDPSADTLVGAFSNRLATALKLPVGTSISLRICRVRDGSIDHISNDMNFGDCLCGLKASGAQPLSQYVDWNLADSNTFCMDCLTLAAQPETPETRTRSAHETTSHAEVWRLIVELLGRGEKLENWPRYDDLRQRARRRAAALAAAEVMHRVKRSRVSPESLIEAAFGLYCRTIDLDDLDDKIRLNGALANIDTDLDSVIGALKVFEDIR
jgi:hypothetical protein